MKKKFVLFFCLWCSSLFAQKSFYYDKFEHRERFLIAGNAAVINESIRLTPSKEWQQGACWYYKKMPVEQGFEVEFKLLINKHGDFGDKKGADGLAFVIQNDRNNALGENGEGIGYHGLRNALAIEFDTFDNGEGSNNHVSIQCNGTNVVTRYSEHTLAINHKIPDLRDKARLVKINYDFQFIRVFIDGTLVLKKEVHLEKLLDLDEGKAWIGFTAATAAGFSEHQILNWKWTKKDTLLVQSDAKNTNSNILNLAIK